MQISVIVHPNSKKPRVEKDLLNILHIYVKEPPLKGKANKAVINSLAVYFHVKPREVMLIHGERTKHKLFEVNTKSF